MLSRLTLRGFKSFAEGTSLQLGPGVNVIVGPNGSGKSNLAEAVVWALGEQRAGRLRAGGMGDVLYSGGERRAAAQLAEVSLVLAGEEADGRVPAEIEATRRLTRAGDSDYRLNGAGCRLLDLQEALASQGIGPDALAVIRQGQVEALCTSTPVERRAMVDAAAGVAVAKRRRRRAEQKLARVGEKLDRARDLAGEVQARARALERQARAAERAAGLDAQIEAARAALGAARAVAAARAHTLALAEAQRRREIAGRDAARLDRARADRAAASEARDAAAAEASAAEAVSTGLRTAAERIGGRAELAEERLASAERALAAREERRAAAAARLGALRAAVERAAAEVAAATAAAERADAAVQAAEAADLEARSGHRAREDAAAAAASALAGAERERQASERRSAESAAAAERARARLAEVAGLGGDDGALARAERRDEISAGRASRWAERAERAELAAADASADRAAAESRRAEARAAARALAPDGSGERGGPAALGDGLVVEPGAERAVAAALGALAEAVPAESVEAARAALDAGATSAAVPAPDREAVPPPAGGRPLWDLVQSCSDGARPHLRRLLAEAWLVERLDDVPLGGPGVAVTADGTALRTADGTLTRSGGDWARRAMHARAVEAERVAEAEVARAAAAAQAAAAALERVVRRRRAAERAAARAARDLATARAEAERRAARGAQAAADAERLGAEALERASEREAAGRAVEEARAAAEVAAEAAAEARGSAGAAAAAYREAATAGADARAQLAAARAAAAEAAARLTSTEAAAEEPGGGAPDLSIARRATESLRAAAERLAPAAEAARGRLAEASARVRDHDGELAGAHGAVEEAERAAGLSGAAAHEAEVALAVAAERAAEAGPVPPGAAEPIDPDEAAAQLADLERRRAAVGAVNPLAAAEREELDDREREMAEQIDDLESASATLRRHLAELDAAVAEGFESLFDSFRDRFAEVCGLLFPGGEGRLRAVTDDDGEAGIEVEVVPAGKRPRSLSLMSGGERSLVALAFCLALAMARPAPFYLLDEVEAALDDVNLRRFLAVVRRLAESTQFLLITHQQPTVEIADTLFGVTMGQEGVSQVLARRLNRDIEGPARPYVRRALRAIPGGRS
ncbi:MAG: chromosome segregation protein SMC [Thermoleophilia bacterium]